MTRLSREAENAPPDTAAMGLARTVTEIKATHDADIFWFSARITRESVQCLLGEFGKAEQRENCIVVLSTFGGDPDAAYVLARFFRRAYARVTVHVFGPCKSAGTLACLGANEIVMGPFGELGPLDIQLCKDDSLAARTSGLDIFQALTIVSTHAFEIFQQHFLGIVGGSGGVITTRTAADIATNVASQLLTPITAQIDPLRLGEMQRALQVAMEYGRRLGVDEDRVRRLAMDYPAHGFVIDVEEARELLPGQVRVAEGQELELEAALRAYGLQRFGQDVIRDPLDDHSLHLCLTTAQAVQRELELNGETADGDEHQEDPAYRDLAVVVGGTGDGEGEPAGPRNGAEAEPQRVPLSFIGG